MPPFPVSLSRFASAQRPIHSLQRQVVYDGNKIELIQMVSTAFCYNNINIFMKRNVPLRSFELRNPPERDSSVTHVLASPPNTGRRRALSGAQELGFVPAHITPFLNLFPRKPFFFRSHAGVSFKNHQPPQNCLFQTTDSCNLAAKPGLHFLSGVHSGLRLPHHHVSFVC